MYPRSNGWRQRSTSNCAWDNDYYHAAQGAPQGPPRRTHTKSPMRSSLSCPSTNEAPCTTRPKVRTCKTCLSWQGATQQQQALKAHAAHPSLTPILTRTGHQYRTRAVKGVPISHKGEVQVHDQHHLGLEGRLVAYELVGPKWQLNVINVHVPFRDPTETFSDHLMEAYRQLATTCCPR